jgi:hypothetical protein
MGLYAVCWELSKRGWNVMPTSRNARGVDIVAFDQAAEKKITVQVKSLSKGPVVPMGKDPHPIADYLVVARGVDGKDPQFFVARRDQLENKIKCYGKKYWLQPAEYERFKDKWTMIGGGDS